MEEGYSFGKGSVFQILDDMAALREERAKENNDVYSVDSYSSPKQHLTVCEKGESDNGAYYNEENSRIEQYNKSVYLEESYSSPQKHAENCADKRDYKNRKKYLKAKYGSSAEYKKAKGIDYSNAKTQFPQSDNIKRYSNNKNNLPQNDNKRTIIDDLNPTKWSISFWIMIIICILFPFLGIIIGVMVGESANSGKKGTILYILSLISMLFQTINFLT